MPSAVASCDSQPLPALPPDDRGPGDADVSAAGTEESSETAGGLAAPAVPDAVGGGASGDADPDANSNPIHCVDEALAAAASACAPWAFGRAGGAARRWAGGLAACGLSLFLHVAALGAAWLVFADAGRRGDASEGGGPAVDARRDGGAAAADAGDVADGVPPPLAGPSERADSAPHLPAPDFSHRARAEPGGSDPPTADSLEAEWLPPPPEFDGVRAPRPDPVPMLALGSSATSVVPSPRRTGRRVPTLPSASAGASSQHAAADAERETQAQSHASSAGTGAPPAADPAGSAGPPARANEPSQNGVHDRSADEVNGEAGHFVPPRVASGGTRGRWPGGGGGRGMGRRLDGRGLPVPAYPAESKRRGEAGLVVLCVQVMADGSVGEIGVQSDPGFPRLVEAAIAAVRAARFTPATRDGLPVAATVAVPFRFVLR